MNSCHIEYKKLENDKVSRSIVFLLINDIYPGIQSTIAYAFCKARCRIRAYWSSFLSLK